jgi:hypothetical protein
MHHHVSIENICDCDCYSSYCAYDLLKKWKIPQVPKTPYQEENGTEDRYTPNKLIAIQHATVIEDEQGCT